MTSDIERSSEITPEKTFLNVDDVRDDDDALGPPVTRSSAVIILTMKNTAHHSVVFETYMVTCQNFEEICKYVRLTVSLSVCLFVCVLRDTGRTF